MNIFEIMNYSFDDYIHKMLEFKYNDYDEVYSPILCPIILRKVYNLWYFSDIYEPKNGSEYYRLGEYYEYYLKDENKSKDMYDMAVKLKDTHALCRDIQKYLHHTQVCPDTLDDNNNKLKDCNKAIEMLLLLDPIDEVCITIAELYINGCHKCKLSQNYSLALDYIGKHPYYIKSLYLYRCIYMIDGNYLEFDRMIYKMIMNNHWHIDLITYIKGNDIDKIFTSIVVNIENIYYILHKKYYSEIEYEKICNDIINEYQYKKDIKSYEILHQIYKNYKKDIDKSLYYSIEIYYNNTIIEISDKILIDIKNFIKEHNKLLLWKPHYHHFWYKTDYDNKIILLLLINKYKYLSIFNYIKYINKNIILMFLQFILTNVSK